MNLMNGHFKYPNKPMLAPSPLTIMSINSNERKGIHCCSDSKTTPAKIPKSMKFCHILGFLAETCAFFTPTPHHKYPWMKKEIK